MSGFHRIAVDHDFRERRNQQILARYGTWENWWACQCAEFGADFMHRLANTPTQRLAETLNGVLPKDDSR